MQKLTKVKEYVAALGEFTGHKHVFHMPKTGFMNIIKEAENAVIEFINGDGVLSHNEHGEVLFIDKSEYEQITQREVDPFTNELRRVQD
jgi:hypothetical protein